MRLDGSPPNVATRLLTNASRSPGATYTCVVAYCGPTAMAVWSAGWPLPADDARGCNNAIDSAIAQASRSARSPDPRAATWSDTFQRFGIDVFYAKQCVGSLNVQSLIGIAVNDLPTSGTWTLFSAMLRQPRGPNSERAFSRNKYVDSAAFAGYCDEAEEFS